MITFVIFEVIPLLIRSIRVFILLYLNLPPNLFISILLAYSFNPLITDVRKLFGEDICEVL